MRNYRIRLSDKTSRLRPRLTASPRGQAYQAKAAIQVRERIEQNDEWLLQCRYMQIEGMAELTPPLIDADPKKLPPMAA